jgi:SAM-dependent methyltransferase
MEELDAVRKKDWSDLTHADRSDNYVAYIPDFTDPRYRDELGWFLYHEKYDREQFGGSYDEERVAYSRLLLEEVLRLVQRDIEWLAGSTVVTVGCGCTGDLSAFPALLKVAIDPLLYAYQKLELLVPDDVGSPTLNLALGAENLPLFDNFADLVICRNALDHMPNPEVALAEIARILKEKGVFFASVDIGGAPTPDEPTVFSVDTLRDAFSERFNILTFADGYPPHSSGRVCSTRIVAQKKPGRSDKLDRRAVLQAYEQANLGG